MSEERFDLIKLSLRENDVKKNDGGGGKPKYFAECNKEMRDFIRGRITELKQAFSKDFESYPEVPAVGKVRLKKDALAKSHRPNKIFNEDTCPIIGVGRFGELLIKVTPDSLDKLDKAIQEADTPKAEANITTIEDIVPNNISDVLVGVELSALKQKYKEHPEEPIKIQLFDYKEFNANRINRDIFKRLADTLGATILGEIKYSDTLISYKVKVPEEKALEYLALYVGVKKLSFFLRYKVEPLRENSLIQSLDISKLIIPNENSDYPMIGMIDSGVAEGHPFLEPWIKDRKYYVPESERNNAHGSFVGGILVYGNELLGNESDTHVKIVDVVAVPNWEKEKGDVGELREDELIVILEEVVKEFKDTIRVWNISLGTNEECREDCFSDIAIKLDDLQRQYNPS
jgi:serine protease AprX